MLVCFVSMSIQDDSNRPRMINYSISNIIRLTAFKINPYKLHCKICLFSSLLSFFLLCVSFQSLKL